jgi:hypothetical protein
MIFSLLSRVLPQSFKFLALAGILLDCGKRIFTVASLVFGNARQTAKLIYGAYFLVGK